MLEPHQPFDRRVDLFEPGLREHRRIDLVVTAEEEEHGHLEAPVTGKVDVEKLVEQTFVREAVATPEQHQVAQVGRPRLRSG